MTDGSTIADTVVEAVTPVVADLGLEVYDVEITGSGKARILRVMIDRPAGPTGERAGIDLDAIAAATEAVSPVLDRAPVDRVLSGPYSLEVSSPGLERPLRTAAHFARAVGETISVKTRAEGKAARVRGQVQAAGDDSFTLLTDAGEEQTITYAEVVQARTVFEWGGSPKQSPKQGSKGRKKETVR
ncbi:MAG: ribosome maturation factor RimP [Acidimicrobiia bacterium]